MLKKVIQPKILAMITIISFVIGSIFSCWGVNIFTTISRGIFLGYFYIMIYLLIILFVKNKNIRKLNLVMIIQLIIALIFGLFVIGKSPILNAILYAILLIMIIGIYLHKKLPYKILMIISLCVLCIEIITIGRLFIVGSFGTLGIQKIIYIKGSNIVYSVGILIEKIICSIGLCSLTVFMYQYGKSINQRCDKNE